MSLTAQRVINMSRALSRRPLMCSLNNRACVVNVPSINEINGKNIYLATTS